MSQYGEVSVAFRVESELRFESVDRGLGGWRVTERTIEEPYTYDYDQIEGEGPTRWARRHGNISNWGVLSAFDGERRVGGAVVAWKTPGVHMLEGRDDLACLWDIRVDPNYRRGGVGSKLLARAASWARDRNCQRLKIETQNINVAACRFYARQGCELRGIHPGVYAELPNEVMLLWYLDL
ncbi:MAG: GNAT family N-acetyltransferase [Chloroflexi bacterium]|nr:GNAT family N-acetyltransferase [Chloroflexota bacterium]